MPPALDTRWEEGGVTADFLEAKAAWLRTPRRLHGSSLRFFELAGTLVSHARFDYPLASLAFFQGAIGLERALKLHYQSNRNLSVLLARTHRDGVLHDALFSSIPALSKRFLRQISVRPATHSEALVALVPELRNQFFHGIYLLAPEYLFLTLQLREIADALTTKRTDRMLRPADVRGSGHKRPG